MRFFGLRMLTSERACAGRRFGGMAQLIAGCDAMLPTAVEEHCSSTDPECPVKGHMS